MAPLLNHFGNQKQAAFYSGGALLVGFTLIGLTGQVVAQAQSHRLDGGYGVRQGLNARCIDGAHGLHNAEKAIDLVQHALALLWLEL